MKRREHAAALIAAVVGGEIEEARRALETSSAADQARLRRAAEQILAMTDQAGTTTRHGRASGSSTRGDAAVAMEHRTPEGVELRVVLPPDAFPTATRAEYVTQNNCDAVLGMSHRQFLDLLRREDAPPVVKLGKLRLVRRDDMVAYVARFRASVNSRDGNAQEPDGASAVLREIGCAPVRR